MKTYKLTYHPDTSPFALMTRIVRAENEQDARHQAYEFLNDELWLDVKQTKCNEFVTWRDALNAKYN